MIGKGRMAKFIRLACVLAVSCFQAQAKSPASVGQYLDSGLTLVEAVERARDQGMRPVEVLDELAGAGVDIVRAVQTISRQWRDCEATYAVVAAAARRVPVRADEIAAAIATLRNCQCDAKNLWARSRINQRLRPEIERALVKVGDVCSCAAAGIEATVAVVPEQIENVIEAVIGAKNTPNNVADSFGQVGRYPTAGQWTDGGSPAIRSRHANLVRLPQTCTGDNNERDDFNPAAQWRSVPMEAIDTLGRHEANCEQGEDKRRTPGQEDNERAGQSLILSQYYEGSGFNQALELYNPTDRAVLLSESPYETEIYFHGYAVPGEVLRLKGVVPPRGTFVVVNAQADNAQLKAKADQLIFGLNFTGADAVVLKNRLEWSNCDCVVVSAAAAIRAGGTEAGETGEARQIHQEPAKRVTNNEWLMRLQRQYATGDVIAPVVDSAGEIPLPGQSALDETENTPSAPVLHSGSWLRKSVVCRGDRLELDPFDPSHDWHVSPEPVAKDLGRHQLGACAETPQELLLSEMYIGAENDQALEIFNATSEPMDFSRDRYMVEIYHDGDLSPDQRFTLAGKLPPGGAFVLVNGSARQALLDKANQQVDGLRLQGGYSVVLRREVAPAYRACYAQVADWLRRDPDPRYLSYIPLLVTEPYIGPQSGDDPRDGDRGGDLASPN